MQTLVGLIALLVIVAGSYLLLQAGGAAAQVLTLLITAGAGAAITRWVDREKYQRELEGKLVSDKKLLYKSYLDLVRSYMAPTNKQPKQEELVARMQTFIYNSVLNASDEVIRAQNTLSWVTSEPALQRFTVPAMGDVLLAMRRDAGLAATDLTSYELMSPLVSDSREQAQLFEDWEAEKGKQSATVASPPHRQPPTPRGRR